MAARMNSRFVVILAIVLGVCFVGVAAVGYTMIRKSADQLRNLGDKQAAAGKWEEAAELYSKAVNKDQQNPELLRLWIGALEKITPTQRQEYRDKYITKYRPALRALAEVSRTDVAAYRRFFDELYTLQARFGAEQGEWDFLMKDVELALRNFTEDPDKAKVLRRYRGLAGSAIIRASTTVDREQVDATRADLRAALEANPDDAESISVLSDIDRIMAARARQDRDEAAADRLIASARSILTNYLDKNPKSAYVLLTLLRLELSETTRRAQAAGKRVDALAEHAALAKRLFEAVLATPPKDLDIGVVSNAIAIAGRVPPDGLATALSLVDHALKDRPDDALLLMARAEALEQGGKPEEAIAVLEKVATLPDRPLSLDGLILLDLRNRAAAKQIDDVLVQWNPRDPVEARQKILDRAKSLRKKLGEQLGETSAVVRLADARIKYQEGDITGARIALTAYLERDGAKDRFAHALLGDLLRRTGDIGEARRCYERVAELDPGNVNARLILAQLAVQTLDLARAESHLQAANQIDPGNKDIEANLAILRDVRAGDKTTDKVMLAIREISAMASDPSKDMAKTIQAARKAAAENGNEPRLIALTAQLMVSNKDRDGAKALVEAALKDKPGDPILLQLQTALKYENALDASLATIEAGEGTPLQKALARTMVYTQHGKTDEAKAQLEIARNLDPNDKSVLEFSFIEAVGAGKLDEAKAIGERAAEKNADGLNGLSYRGRLAIAEKRFSDAVAVFTQAAEVDRYNSLVWRFLGDSRFMLNQFEESAAAYDRALETKPTDVICVKGSIRAHYRAGHLDQALASARRALQSNVGSNDVELFELWLQLEAAAPSGDRAQALRGRRNLAKQRPDDMGNKLQLAALLVDDKAFDEAKATLDELKSKPGVDMANVVDLEARWYAVKGDLGGAQRVFAAYIDSLPAEKRTDDPYMRLAGLLAYVNRNEEAVVALKEGMKYQDPKQMNAQRQLAYVYIRMGKFEEAQTNIRQVLAGVKDDPGLALTKGIIDCYLQLGKFAEAEAEIAKLGDAAGKDQTLILQQARAAVGRKDYPRARRLFDQAVAVAPNSPLGYFTRAEFTLNTEPERQADAETDLAGAIRVDPRFVPARQRLYQIYLTTGRPEQAMTQLREALAANPDDDQIRLSLVTVLMGRGDAKGAADQVAEALKRKPDSIQWAVQACDVFIKAGNPEEALPFVDHAWKLQKSVPVALAYAELIMATKKPDLALARDIVGDKALFPEKNFQLLLTRARIYKLANQGKESEADIIDAYKLVDCGDSLATTSFFNALNKIYTDFGDQCKLLDLLNSKSEFKDWCALNDLAIRVIDKKARPALIPRLQALSERSDNEPVAYAAASLIANLYGEEGKFEDAAKFFKRCVDLRPNEPEANNNYAYVVGEELKRPEEAIPYAEKAIAGNPLNVGMLDTLATLHMRVGKLDKAEEIFRRALNNATNPEDRAPVFLHVAELQLMKGNKAEARRYIEMLEVIFKEKPGLKVPYGAGLEASKKKLEAP